MKTSIRLVVVLTVVCLISALLVSIADSVTREPIRLAKEKQKMASVYAVMPEGTTNVVADTIVITAENGSVSTNEYWKTNNGYVIPVTVNNGYSGRIELVLGFAGDNLWSYKVLSHSETPGLGAHVAGSFIDHVKGKPIFGTNWKTTKDGGDIEQITAATISSRAVCGAISEGIRILEQIEIKEYVRK